MRGILSEIYKQPYVCQLLCEVFELRMGQSKSENVLFRGTLNPDFHDFEASKKS